MKKLDYSVSTVDPAKGPKIHTSKEVFDTNKGYAKADREQFFVIFMDAKNAIIKKELHSIGSLSSAPIYPREIIKSAIKYNASSMIFLHNHPSGDPEPSDGDIAMTRLLITATEIFDLKVLDHIILGHDKYFSFADSGWIDKFSTEAKKLGFSRV